MVRLSVRQFIEAYVAKAARHPYISAVNRTLPFSPSGQGAFVGKRCALGLLSRLVLRSRWKIWANPWRPMLPVIILAAALARPVALIAGPDDQFVTIYNLIQVADSEKESGRMTDAHRNYSKAQDDLQLFRRQYPTWNERVINFRLRYVAERLEALKEFAAKTSDLPAPAAAEAAAPAGEVLAQFNSLNEQVQRLSGEKQLLEAKLREALSAQPAPIDPRELQRAVERIANLQSTNRFLLDRLEQQQAERRNLVEKVVAEEAQRALLEANRQLQKQKATAELLTRERSELETQLRKIQDSEVKPLKLENTTLKGQVAELKTDTDRGRQIADLAAKLVRLQLSLDETQAKNQALATDKSVLEKQLDEARIRQTEESVVRVAKLEGELAVARADARRVQARAEEIAVELQKERLLRAELESKARALEERLAVLTKGGGAPVEVVRNLETELATERTARARLEQELRVAQEKLAAVTASATTVVASSAPLIPAVGEVPAASPPSAPSLTTANPAVLVSTNLTLASLGLSEGLWPSSSLVDEVQELRAALVESRSRELEIQNLLAEERGLRARLERERAELERRLAALPSEPLTAPAKSLEDLEMRVKALESRRAEINTRLIAIDTPTELGVGRSRLRPQTSRDEAVDFRLRYSVIGK